ncbi:MAG: hypothetical protein ACLVJN_07695 [Streptococcus parasanguinis]
MKKSTILNGFSKIFLSKEKADGDGEFHQHQLELSACSNFFRKR